jgi:hypothetical protein
VAVEVVVEVGKFAVEVVARLVVVVEAWPRSRDVAVVVGRRVGMRVVGEVVERTAVVVAGRKVGRRA